MRAIRKVQWTICFIWMFLTGICAAAPGHAMAVEIPLQEAGLSEEVSPVSVSSNEAEQDYSVMPGESMNILFVGNSLTKFKAYEKGCSVPDHFEKMMNASGRKVHVVSVARSGAALKNYAGMTQKRNYQQRFLKKLNSAQWDYVIIQERSKLYCTKYETDMVPAVKWMLEQIKLQSPGAQVLLYLPRGFDLVQEGMQGSENGAAGTITSYEMECQMGAAGDRITQRFHIASVPVGMQFYRASLLCPEINLTGPDYKHPSRQGYFLAASCIYQKIFGEEPKLNKEVLSYAGLTKKQARKLVRLWDGGLLPDTAELTLKVGEKHRMQVTEQQGNPVSEIRFSSLKESVARVDDVSGEITAVGSGMTVIVAESVDGWQAYTTVYVPYDTPSGLSVQIHNKQKEGQKSAGIKLSWKKENGVSYKVYRSSSKNGTYELLATVKKGQYTDNTAAVGKTWYYRVAAGNAYQACESKKTSAASVILRRTGEITVKSVGRTKAKISWKKAKKTSGYLIYRAETKDGTYKKIAEASPDKGYYMDSDRKQGKTYYYKVVAYG